MDAIKIRGKINTAVNFYFSSKMKLEGLKAMPDKLSFAASCFLLW
jgi:hypothetical protein